jgi:hypothetical protein
VSDNIFQLSQDKLMKVKCFLISVLNKNKRLNGYRFMTWFDHVEVMRLRYLNVSKTIS